MESCMLMMWGCIGLPSAAAIDEGSEMRRASPARVLGQLRPAAYGDSLTVPDAGLS
jgi:hypothetical protein